MIREESAADDARDVRALWRDEMKFLTLALLLALCPTTSMARTTYQITGTIDSRTILDASSNGVTGKTQVASGFWEINQILSLRFWPVDSANSPSDEHPFFYRISSPGFLWIVPVYRPGVFNVSPDGIAPAVFLHSGFIDPPWLAIRKQDAVGVEPNYLANGAKMAISEPEQADTLISFDFSQPKPDVFFYIFGIDGGAGIKLSFRDVSIATVSGLPVTGIPEPETWWMLLLGFSVLGMVLRRKANKAAVAAN